MRYQFCIGDLQSKCYQEYSFVDEAQNIETIILKVQHCKKYEPDSDDNQKHDVKVYLLRQINNDSYALNFDQDNAILDHYIEMVLSADIANLIQALLLNKAHLTPHGRHLYHASECHRLLLSTDQIPPNIFFD